MQYKLEYFSCSLHSILEVPLLFYLFEIGDITDKHRDNGNLLTSEGEVEGLGYTKH